MALVIVLNQGQSPSTKVQLLPTPQQIAASRYDDSANDNFFTSVDDLDDDFYAATFALLDAIEGGLYAEGDATFGATLTWDLFATGSLYDDSANDAAYAATFTATGGTQGITSALYDDSATDVGYGVDNIGWLDDFGFATFAPINPIAGAIYTDAAETTYASTFAPGAVNVAGALYADAAEATYAATAAPGPVNIAGALWTDADGLALTQTWAKGAVNIAGALFDDSANDAGYANTWAKGAVNVAGALFADNAETTYGATLTLNIAGGLYVDAGEAIYASTSAPGAVNVAGALFADNAETTYGSSSFVGIGFVGGGVTADDATYASTTAGGPVNITGSLWSDGDAIYAATAAPGAVNVGGALFAADDATYAATCSATGAPQAITGTLYVDADTTTFAATLDLDDDFYAATFQLLSAIAGALYIDTDATYTATFGKGAVNIAGTLYADADAIPIQSIVLQGAPQTITGALYVDADVTYASHPALDDDIYSATFALKDAIAGALYIDADLVGAANFIASSIIPIHIDLTGWIFSSASYGSEIAGPSSYANKLIEGTSLDVSHAAEVLNVPYTDGFSYAISVELAPGERTWASLGAIFGDGENGYIGYGAYVDLTNQAVSAWWSAGPLTYDIVNLGGGFFRLDMSFIVSGIGSGVGKFELYIAEPGDNINYNGDGTSGIYVGQLALYQSSGAISGSTFTDPDAAYSATASLSIYSITGGGYVDPDITYASHPDTDDDYYSATFALGLGAQTIAGTLYTDADAFFADTEASPFPATGDYYADPEVFYAATVAGGGLLHTIAASLYVDPDTAYASHPDTDDDYYPATWSGYFPATGDFYVDVETFYRATISEPAGTVTATLYTDTDASYSAIADLDDDFYRATFTLQGAPQIITGALWLDVDATYTSIAGRTVGEALYTDTDAAYAATTTCAITRTANYADSDTAFAATFASAGAITGGNYIDADAFFGAGRVDRTVLAGYWDDRAYEIWYTQFFSYGVVAATFADQDTTYTATASAANAISAALYVDLDAIFASIETIDLVAGGLFVDDGFFFSSLTQVSTSNSVTASSYTDVDATFGATLSALAGIAGTMFTDADATYGASAAALNRILATPLTEIDGVPTAGVALGFLAGYFAEVDAIYLPTGGALDVSGLYTDTDIIFGARLSSGVTATLYTDTDATYGAAFSAQHDIAATPLTDADVIPLPTVAMAFEIVATEPYRDPDTFGRAIFGLGTQITWFAPVTIPLTMLVVDPIAVDLPVPDALPCNIERSSAVRLDLVPEAV